MQKVSKEAYRCRLQTFIRVFPKIFCCTWAVGCPKFVQYIRMLCSRRFILVESVILILIISDIQSLECKVLGWKVSRGTNQFQMSFAKVKMLKIEDCSIALKDRNPNYYFCVNNIEGDICPKVSIIRRYRSRQYYKSKQDLNP